MTQPFYDPWTGVDPSTPEPAVSTDDTFDQWAIVELMGHRRIAARVREATIAGAGFLRLDEPAVDGQPGRTQYVSPSSLYALHPTTEQVVQAMAGQWRSAPVQRWELPAAPAESPGGADDAEGHSDHDFDPWVPTDAQDDEP